jgi:hypothetical protein
MADVLIDAQGIDRRTTVGTGDQPILYHAGHTDRDTRVEVALA